MKKGDIILVPFPFTDLKGFKKRPAVVLYNDSFDVVVSFITTNLVWNEKTDILIKPNNTNRLKRTSLIRTNKLATIKNTIIIGKIGELDRKTVDELNEKLIQIFELT
jgi:mRNA interferase MazF